MKSMQIAVTKVESSIALDAPPDLLLVELDVETLKKCADSVQYMKQSRISGTLTMWDSVLVEWYMEGKPDSLHEDEGYLLGECDYHLADPDYTMYGCHLLIDDDGQVRVRIELKNTTEEIGPCLVMWTS